MKSSLVTHARRMHAVAFAICVLGLIAASTTLDGAPSVPASRPAETSEGAAPPVVSNSAAIRFAHASEEIPDLRRHVVPLLAKLGCSAAACHGAKEGQGGFQLSLFGFDYLADVAEMADEQDPPRANWKAPPDSAILLKPTMQIDHGGGERFKPDGWEHRLLLQWIEARAPGVKANKEADFVQRLELRPPKLTFDAMDGANQEHLHVIAHWSDGTSEDVTPLARYQSNNDAVVSVSADGQVAQVGPGDTHIVAFYDQAIASVPAFVTQKAQPDGSNSTAPSSGSIDALVEAKLHELGITPSPECSDEEFLRRVSLDLTGTLPTAVEVEEFLALTTPNKRETKIEELLSSEQYARWWSTWLCDLTGNNESMMPTATFRTEQSKQWYQWILKRVRENVSYDKIVEGLVVAPSRTPDQSYADYCIEMSSYVRRDNPADFAGRPTMPYFWGRFNLRSPADKTLAFAYSFLGVQIQCAECHKHPFDRWTRKDFDGLQAFFATIQQGRPADATSESELISAQLEVPKGVKRDGYIAELARGGKTIPWTEIFLSESRRGARIKDGAARLETLMDWMREREHPYLAIAFVNRVWHHYFGVGIVDPPDDLSLANPPSNRELLDHLTVGFVNSGYDMKWLHRSILVSHAYQRSSQTNSTNSADTRNFSRSLLRRLPAEVLYDAAWVATANDQASAIASENRAIGEASGLGRSDGRFGLLQSLGKPGRNAVCERERSNLPTLAQSLFLQNSPQLHEMLSRKDGWLHHASREFLVTDEAKANEFIRLAYLRTLNRAPSIEETATCRRFLAESANGDAGLQGVVWALINSKEFCINR